MPLEPPKESKELEPTLVIGIPAFNVEKTIAKVAIDAFQHSDNIIVCDDGSTDRTSAIAKKIGCDVVTHDRNMGYGSAIKTILKRAREKQASVLVTVDGDGQHDLNAINPLVKPILEGEADVVIGSRFLDNEVTSDSTPRMRKFGIKTITSLTGALINQNVSDAQSGFRAYNKRAIEVLNPGEQGMGASTEILLKAKESGLRIVEVPTTITYKGGKTSTLNPLFHYADVVSSTIKVASIRHPLMSYGIPGALLLVLSLIFAGRTIQVFASQGQFETNVALISIGLAVIGTILVTVGLILFVIVTAIREQMR